jgi:hypothetical protein
LLTHLELQDLAGPSTKLRRRLVKIGASTRGNSDANASGSVIGAGRIPDQALHVSKHKGGLMKQRKLVFVSTCIAAFLASWIVPAHAQEAALYPSHSPPFTSTLSNTAPLAFGMDAMAATDALGVPLNYISGRPGNEVFLAFRSYGGSGFFNRKDRLYLQFRKGHLVGWKGDWGRNWMWR